MVDQTLPIASQLEQAVTIIKKQVKAVLDTKAEAAASKKQVACRAFARAYVVQVYEYLYTCTRTCIRICHIYSYLCSNF